jgi:oligoribonuclease (3'-5' exoribonuclease)
MEYPMLDQHVRPKSAISKARVSAALSAGWARVMGTRKGAMADAIEVNSKTIDRALTHESTPELHTAFNSLVFDPTALDEVANLYGMRLTPKNSVASNDHTTMADLAALIGQFATALSDGKRIPRETCQLADAIRPILCELGAIVEEADRIKGVAA